MKAKKSLGQNFLKSKSVVSDIVKTAKINPEDIVLEIGPGKGVLTEALLEKAKKVIAIEKDDQLFFLLKEKFKDEIKSGKLELINEDVLKINPPKYGLNKGEYLLVANIPYYITGEILSSFLESTYQPKRIVLMVQKEVAKRIVAQDKKGSILSISVKVYGKPKYIQKVPARNFSPAPNVDSAILLIDNISSKFKNQNEEKKFFEILKKGFVHKRKLLISNLKLLPNIDSKKLEQIFLECNIPTKNRPENLSVNDWLCLLEKIR